MFLFFCFFGFPEGFLQNQQILRESQTYKIKPKNTKTTLGNTKNNKVFKRFRPTLGYVFFFCVWFSRRFLQNQQILRENQQYQRKPKNTNKTLGTTNKHKVFKGFRPTLGYVFLFLFWFSRRYFWCSLVFLFFSKVFFWFCKNFRENQTTKQTNPYPRVSLKPLKTLLFVFVPNVLFVFFGFLLYCWFSLRCFWFCKKLSGNQKNKKKQTHIQG